MNPFSSTFRSIAVVVFIVSSAHHSDAHRRVLLPNENIADLVGGVDHSRFTITAQVQGPDDANNPFWDGNSEPKVISMDVIEAQPAITADTYIISEDGTQIRFGDSSNSLATLLVSDVATSAGRSGFTILAVDPITREMQGVTQLPGGGMMKIRQESDGGVVSAVKEEEMAMPAWDEGDEDQAESVEDQAEGAEDYENFFNRESPEKHYHGSHEHERNHHDHDHYGEDHHEASDSSNISANEILSKSIRGTNVNRLNEQRIQGTLAAYSYQVNLFLEIDWGFIENTGDGPIDYANGIPKSAYNYINKLVTAANVVFESEIDTHLHVQKIKLSTIYWPAKTSNEALEIMKEKYAGKTWHAKDVDLHHALLGNKAFGGLADIGGLCDPQRGFGLTTGISGNFADLDQKAVLDLFIFMHELGHQFGAGHTHTDTVPPLEQCGKEDQCPKAGGNKWATIMSYCYLCPGGYSNVMYTFGGRYKGSGNKDDIKNWINNPELTANFDSTHKSYGARRVPHYMYWKVSKASCTHKSYDAGRVHNYMYKQVSEV